MQACDRCHSRKTRCDRRLPSCTACEKAGAQCLHRDKLRQRHMPRGYVDGIESRLQTTSEENARLRHELATLRSSVGPGNSGSSQATINSPRAHSWDQGSYSVNPVMSDGQTDTRRFDAGLSGSPQGAINSNNGNGWNQGSYNANPVMNEERTDARRSTDSPAVEPPTSAENTPGSAEDAVSTEVGYLSLKATGETRYVGSSSGIGLASIISHMVDEGAGLTLLPTDMRDANPPGPLNTAGPCLDSSLPPRQSAMPFIEAYFQHTHITFPLLHRTSFLRTVDQIYSDPDYYASHTYDAYVFDMVLSIGSSNFNRFGDASASSATHYSRAQSKLPAVLGMPSLRPLRAIILLSQHGIFSNLKDTSASIWHLIGIGVRICYEMGLHLEPRYPGNSGDAQSRPVTFEEEMNRRCFWCLYNLDRVVSFTLGRPAAIKDEDIDVSLPAYFDDSEFGPGRPLPQQLATGLRSSPFLHLIRIRRLSGEILVAFYAARQNPNLSYDEKRKLRQKLHEQVVKWKDDTVHLNLVAKPEHNGSFKSCFLSEEWYTAVFNNAMLLLYRPSPSFPHPTNSANQSNEEGDLLHLFTAAKSTINAYAELHSKRRLNYSWITLHGVFLAGLAYVYCVGRALKDPTPLLPVPAYLEIIDDTRACSNVLVAICERWNVVRRSCELFNRLSNAVIRDAVNDAAKQHHRTFTQTYTPDQSSRPVQSQATPTQGSAQQHSTAPSNFNDFGMAMDQIPMGDHFFVADEFRQYSETFDGMFSDDQTFPSELVTGFSQDWPFDDTFVQQPTYGMPMQHEDNLQH
ncbi:hypothetical protein BU16DRAFT_579601 [Lophium mytilinum]|uniref:Zn(2)-C6 fungal-type domain-containing protein n=1 Tax=Lophium mytilinum TaxID=390894 RepID=A0A6A6R126_9PEZI|nr:hypothetical protein BU16DRAFT_579601 [Lophium mytilinum]